MTPSPKSSILELRGISGNTDFSQLVIIVFEGTKLGVPGLVGGCFYMGFSIPTYQQSPLFIYFVTITLQLWIVIKMLANAQQIASSTTNHILHQLSSKIHSLQKVNRNKPAHSAQQILQVVTEINDQISYAPDNHARLQTPKDLPSLRMDSYMSVFTVETPHVVPRHRSHTKTYRRRKSTIDGDDGVLGFRKKRRITYNKIEPLGEEREGKASLAKQQIQEEGNQMEDKFRADLEKKIAEMTVDKKLKTRAKFLSAQQLRQKFSYDYECKRIKVSPLPRKNLILKILESQPSKHIAKHALPHKIDKPEIRTLETTKVVERVARKTKKSRKQAEEVVEPQNVDIDVQFSEVRSLSQRFVCQPGVCFKFEGDTIRNRKLKTDANGQEPKRYSKLDFFMEKKRSVSNNSKLGIESNRSLHKQLFPSNKHTQRTDINNLTIDTEKLSTRLSKISISNQIMHRYLLTPEDKPASTPISDSNSSYNREKLEPVPLDGNDKFNLNYIRGIQNKNEIVNRTVKMEMPLIHREKEPHLRVRQKLQNKMTFLQGLKRKFQENLRIQKQKLISI